MDDGYVCLVYIKYFLSKLNIDGFYNLVWKLIVLNSTAGASVRRIYFIFLCLFIFKGLYHMKLKFIKWCLLPYGLTSGSSNCF